MRMQTQGHCQVLSLLLLLSLSPVLTRAHFGAVREEDLGGSKAATPETTRTQAVPGAKSEEAQNSNAVPLRFQGVYVVRTVSLTNGGDVLAHLLRTQDSGLLEMDIDGVENQFELIGPGKTVEVVAVRTGTHQIQVRELNSQPSGTVTIKSASDVDFNLEQELSTDAFAELGGSKVQAAWTQSRTVGDMSVLFIISSICGQPAATTVPELEKVVFTGPGSKAKTLEAYYKECSYGLTNMNASNSKVVGTVNIPCTYTCDEYTFDANMCAFADADGWMKYAVSQVQPLYGVDPTQYRHRVLLLPPYYIYQAGCRWVGLGTLGPDATGPEGEYLYSSVWLTGDFWRHVAAYMHELGHTNYLHHSAQGTCVYCDMSCVMGDCCDTRCFNPVHNWQLGWGKPIVTLNAETVPVGQTLSFTLPTQQSSRTHMLLIFPNWIPDYGKQNLRGFGIFMGYRTDTGKYDDDMPPEYLYATNVYTFDGQSQFICRYSWLWASVGTGQEYRNSTWQLSIKQLQGTSEAALIAVCRWSEAQETSCSDGIDNDCDGLVDELDPDCHQQGVVQTWPTHPNPPRPPCPTSPPPAEPTDGTSRPMKPPAPMAPPKPKAPKKWGKKWRKKKPPPPSPAVPASPSPPDPESGEGDMSPPKKWGKKKPWKKPKKKVPKTPQPPNPPSPPIPKKWLWKYRPRPPPPYTQPDSPLLDLFAHLEGEEPAQDVANLEQQGSKAAADAVPAAAVSGGDTGAGRSGQNGETDDEDDDSSYTYFYYTDVPPDDDSQGRDALYEISYEYSDEDGILGEESSGEVSGQEDSTGVTEPAPPTPPPGPPAPPPVPEQLTEQQQSPPPPVPPSPSPTVGAVHEGDKAAVREDGGQDRERRLAAAGEQLGEAGSKYSADDWAARQHQPERQLSDADESAGDAVAVGSQQAGSTAQTQQVRYKWKDATEEELWKQIQDPHRRDSGPSVAALGDAGSDEPDGVEAGRSEAVQRWAESIDHMAKQQLQATIPDKGGRSMLEQGQAAAVLPGEEAGIDLHSLEKHLAIGGDLRDENLRYRFKLVHGSRSGSQDDSDK